MCPQPRLKSLYEEWRQLSEAEGSAIQSASWSRVLLCQSRKSDLQRQILAIMQADGAPPLLREDWIEPFRPVIAELIELENRNSRWLADSRAGMEKERGTMERRHRNLKQLRQAYGSSASAPRWNSYS